MSKPRVDRLCEHFANRETFGPGGRKPVEVWQIEDALKRQSALLRRASMLVGEMTRLQAELLAIGAVEADEASVIDQCLTVVRGMANDIAHAGEINKREFARRRKQDQALEDAVRQALQALLDIDQILAWAFLDESSGLSDAFRCAVERDSERLAEQTLRDARRSAIAELIDVAKARHGAGMAADAAARDALEQHRSRLDTSTALHDALFAQIRALLVRAKIREDGR